MGLTPLDNFEAIEVQTKETSIFLRRLGSGPGVLLLHGFPQTHLMWREVAPLLAHRFTVICAHPDLGERLAVLDVLPIAEVWERADKKLATGYWPWSLLAQPEPLPERLVSAAPDAVVDNALRDWGSSSAHAFSPEVRAAYIEALSDPARVHAICEEYRAAATLDHEHDLDDRQAGRRITCPVLALWSGRGPLTAGMERQVARWRYGGTGPAMYVVSRSMAAISFQRKFRSGRRKN